ncbi:uncharacterized protein LOC126166016 [Schistocerca cancellata]|uniref:uncharacterized protein LOC126166016 n=1 Tax=Schistocerca cancellata TaxID=274614 RepID=UPI002118C43F|nr:uncharacterized protein LOC126166016 [Schistocerca cancellata]
MASNWSSPIRGLVVVGSSVAVCGCAYLIYRYWKQRDARSIDEGFEDVSRLEDNPERRVLVLGLNNSGKSTLLNQVTTGSTDAKTVKPTEGFRVTSLQNKDVSLNIWEIGGGPNVRPYWSNFLQDTDLLVFVVDAADDHNLPLAFRELKSLLGDERLAHVPLLVLANKQDLPNAKNSEEIADILDLNSIPASKHKVRVVGTTAIPSTEIARHPSILEVQQALFSMTNV